MDFELTRSLNFIVPTLQRVNAIRAAPSVRNRMTVEACSKTLLALKISNGYTL